MTSFREQALIHIDRNQIDQAIDQLQQHLNTNFFDWEAIHLLGTCFIDRGMNGHAAALLSHSLEIQKQATGKPWSRTLLNLGAAYRNEKRFTEAADLFRLAIDAGMETKVEEAHALSNSAGCHLAEGRFEQSLEESNRAVECAAPKVIPDILFNRSFAHLALGHWVEGWEDHEAGFNTHVRSKRTYPGIPEWDGSKGKRLIVWGEQGIGDEIMFASVLPDAIRDSAKVILDCHPRLIDLMKRSFPMCDIYGTRKQMQAVSWVDEAEAEAAISISQLCRFYRTTDQSFPGAPYLKAESAPALRAGQSKPRIGISWVGGTKLTNGEFRSISLEKWLPILKAVDAEWFSLQYTSDAARQACELEEKHGVTIHHWPGWVEARNYDRTATFVDSLDLVITVATSIYHLCGSLGVPVWVLASSKPSWRYTPQNELWYRQTARFFRQSGTDWAPVMADVAAALRDVEKKNAA